MIRNISVSSAGQGLQEITSQVEAVVREARTKEGLCTLFLQHTSASLLIQENADPSAKRDLEQWLSRLVKEDDPLYSHTAEGSDDMPSHIKAALTATSLSVPIQNGRLALGTWQGIYLWEHRRHRGTRKIVIHIGG
jgi:secondary thiamine-phosphate synthase enzyme